MDANKQVKELISYHLDQVKYHQKKADLLMEYFGKDDDSTQNSKSETRNSNLMELAKGLKYKGTKRSIALNMLKDVNKSHTMKEWQSIYNEKTGTDESDDIKMTLRLLRMDRLVANKDYGKNIVKWGLVDWFDENTKDFKPEYK